MKVIETSGGTDSLTDPPIAIVDADGLRRKVRLDLVDRIPEPGDYLIIHAGFAVNCLDASEAKRSLELMSEIAASVQQA